jgi:hypothetical protein
LRFERGEDDCDKTDGFEDEGSISLRLKEKQREAEPFRIAVLGDKRKFMAVVTPNLDLGSNTAVAAVVLVVGRTLQTLPIFYRDNLKHFLGLSASGGKGSSKLSHMNLECFRFFMDPQVVSVAVVRLWLERFIQAWCAVTNLEVFYTDVFAGLSTQLSKSGEGSLQSALASEVLGVVKNAMMVFGLVFRRPDAGSLSQELLAKELKMALCSNVPRVLARSAEKNMASLKRRMDDDSSSSGFQKKRVGQTAAVQGGATATTTSNQPRQGMCLSFMCHNFA